MKKLEIKLATPEMLRQKKSLRPTHALVDKINHWIHSYSYGDITLKFIHPQRGNEAIKDIGIIPFSYH